MPNIFNIAEVIDMGIAKEEKRRDFYGLVAESFKEKEMKELFGRLRDWEAEHIKKFTAIRDSAEESEVRESYKGEFAAYIKALVDDKLYAQVSPKEFAANVKKPIDAIRYGIGFEKDAILFFNELIGSLEGPHKDKVLELLNEEKQHIVYLTELKRRYE